ncbi:hypothetical protein [Paraburkholderia gardini]|uniref:hypothetical protein n=1 Tax=Paraburkholderia gardini TaxID=2823469 RepID=UPI001D975EA4|nr:hypothetical protein [Paraburkholderia gardini]CAG4889607.1 hypothetical protein R69919_00781 [Paraburkholderia gardini]
MSKKTNVAHENVSKLASLGIAAMEYEVARRSAYVELKAVRDARKEWNIENGHEEDLPPEAKQQYSVAAKRRKNARERLQRMISRYRDWLDGVNS